MGCDVGPACTPVVSPCGTWARHLQRGESVPLGPQSLVGVGDAQGFVRAVARSELRSAGVGGGQNLGRGQIPVRPGQLTYPKEADAPCPRDN